METNGYHIRIFLGQQTLCLYNGDTLVEEFKVSTATNGPGEILNSECTPRGMHRVHEKIGEGSLPGTVFVGRKPTGEIYSPELESRCPQRDWILTRILTLCGDELGKNKGGEVDTLERMIYIHGSPDNVEMGVPGSHGCIRMSNKDVIRLFDRVEPGAWVCIEE